MHIAPYIEQGTLYSLVNFSPNGSGWPWWQKFPGTSRDLISAKCHTFICPSDTRGDENWQDGGHSVAITSYLGVSGTDSYKESQYNVNVNGSTVVQRGQNGVIYVNSAVTFGKIKDGSASTLVVGERSPADDLLYGWQWAGAGDNALGEADVVLGVHERIAVDWGADPNGYETDYFRQGTSQDGGSGEHRFHFWSNHPGGGQWGMADGSVHFLTYATDSGRNGSTGNAQTVLEQLATRDGGETTPQF